MSKLILKPKEDRRIARGHLWVYRNQLSNEPELDEGAVVDVASADGKYAGVGFYQAGGGIAVRMLSRRRVDVDSDFFRKRIAAALELRQALYPGQSTYRWVHAESDGLPGFAADRYGPVVSARTSCAFYSSWADDLAAAFLAHPGVEGVRIVLDGDPREFGDIPDNVVVEFDGLRLNVPLRTGQKTGLFLDQRENARFLDHLANGARVFDGHCNVGAWGLRAARSGAEMVRAVDTSEHALEEARRNAELNGLNDVCRFEKMDVTGALLSGETYDVVCLDPPSLVKARPQLSKGLTLYQALNRDAMRALRPGGYLITSSCSQLVSQDDFLEALKRAARSARCQVSLLAMRGAPPDHPVLLTMPETAYLKCAVVKVNPA